MPTDTRVAVRPPGPKLDAELWTLLGQPLLALLAALRGDK